MANVYYGKGKWLFREKGYLANLFKDTKADIKNGLTHYPIENLMRFDENDCVRFLVDKYSIQTLEIDESRIFRDDPVVHYSNLGDYVETEFIFFVPYSGDAVLFQYTPATNLQTVSAVLTEQDMELHYLIKERIGGNFTEPKKTFENGLALIKTNLEWTKKSVDKFNNELEPVVRQIIVKIKEVHQATQAAAEATGVKIKRRQDLAEPYKVPISPKKKKVRLPFLTAQEEKNWAITEDGYEDILDIVRSMSTLMEQLPKTFAKLKEEEIRDHFLMLLNIYFEGQTTGETFNSEGKTDILIKAGDQNVFIAECKFWDGQEKFKKAINQLFTYTNWRDTKTAIILFHKKGNFTSVKDKMHKTLMSHPNFIGEHKLSNVALAQNETISSYILHYPDDKQREVIVTTMGFNVHPRLRSTPTSGDSFV
jgi:hypothetical protein